MSCLPEVTRSCLVANGDVWFDWLVTATAVLFVGAIAEYWLEHEHRSPFVWLRTRPSGLKLKPHIRGSQRFIKLERRCKFIALIMVVAGIGGEGIFEILSAKAETAVREFDQTHNEAAERETSNRLGAARRELDRAKTALGSEIQTAQEAAKAAGLEASKAQALAADARRQVTSAEKDILVAKRQLADVEAKAAQAKEELLGLAICMAPRVFSYDSVGDLSSLEAFKALSGHSAIVQYLPGDAEARRAAFNIAGALKLSGWAVSMPVPAEGIKDGIEVNPYMSGPAIPDPRFAAEYESIKLAHAFVAILHSYNWQAIFSYATDEHGIIRGNPQVVPLNGIRIRVGLYPPTSYIPPPSLKEISAAEAQILKRSDELSKEREKENADALARLPGLDRQKAEEITNAYNKTVKEALSGFAQPCRPLLQIP